MVPHVIGGMVGVSCYMYGESGGLRGRYGHPKGNSVCVCLYFKVYLCLVCLAAVQCLLRDTFYNSIYHV